MDLMTNSDTTSLYLRGARLLKRGMNENSQLLRGKLTGVTATNQYPFFAAAAGVSVQSPFVHSFRPVLYFQLVIDVFGVFFNGFHRYLQLYGYLLIHLAFSQ